MHVFQVVLFYIFNLIISYSGYYLPNDILSVDGTERLVTCAKCNSYCEINESTCDDITTNASYSKLISIYRADNECDDAENKYDQWRLSDTKLMDRITFYTQQGFDDIINIIDCVLADQQYTCNINAHETGLETSDDESYRLPTMYLTIIPAINPTRTTYKSSNLSIQIYNNENKRLEFYIYYNDCNGINMIFGSKWIHYELLDTYTQCAITSINAEWNNAGLMNITFCSVYNVNNNYNDKNKYDYCNNNSNDENIETNGLPSHLNVLSDKYRTYIQISGQINAEYVADESVNAFQLFTIDIFTSYLFNNCINTVGFDDIFRAIEIIVQPVNPIKQNTINHTENINCDYNVNIILDVLIGVIICIYGIRFYFTGKKKEETKKKNKYKHNREGIEGKKDKSNIETAINDEVTIQQRKHCQPIPSVAPSTIITQTLHINSYLKDNKLMAPGYYLNKLQQVSLSHASYTDYEKSYSDLFLKVY